MKKLTQEEKAKYQEIYEKFLDDPRLLRIGKIQQHRGSNTFLHVCKVTKYAYKLAKGSCIKINFEDLITGAMLHDYFLYDWREDKSKLKRHGHKHPMIALENAKKDFEINDRVANIIVSHMWPINLFHIHHCVEAHLVSLADKHVSIGEALTSRKHKLKIREKVLTGLFVLED